MYTQTRTDIKKKKYMYTHDKHVETENFNFHTLCLQND